MDTKKQRENKREDEESVNQGSHVCDDKGKLRKKHDVSCNEKEDAKKLFRPQKNSKSQQNASTIDFVFYDNCSLRPSICGHEKMQMKHHQLNTSFVHMCYFKYSFLVHSAPPNSTKNLFTKYGEFL